MENSNEVEWDKEKQYSKGGYRKDRKRIDFDWTCSFGRTPIYYVKTFDFLLKMCCSQPLTFFNHKIEK